MLTINKTTAALALAAVAILAALGGFFAGQPTIVECINCGSMIEAQTAHAFSHGDNVDYWCDTCVDNGGLVNWYKVQR